MFVILHSKSWKPAICGPAMTATREAVLLVGTRVSCRCFFVLRSVILSTSIVSFDFRSRSRAADKDVERVLEEGGQGCHRSACGASGKSTRAAYYHHLWSWYSLLPLRKANQPTSIFFAAAVRADWEDTFKKTEAKVKQFFLLKSKLPPETATEVSVGGNLCFITFAGGGNKLNPQTPH